MVFVYKSEPVRRSLGTALRRNLAEIPFRSWSDIGAPEPPLPNHPFWIHPQIWLTPHIASPTQAESGADAVIANLRNHLAGKMLHGKVDTRRGY